MPVFPTAVEFGQWWRDASSTLQHRSAKTAYLQLFETAASLALQLLCNPGIGVAILRNCRQVPVPASACSRALFVVESKGLHCFSYATARHFKAV